MESVPPAPGQQTRNTVTRRITARVTRGWPRLGEPIVRHRLSWLTILGTGLTRHCDLLVLDS